MANRYLHLITSLRHVAFRLLPVVLLFSTLITAAQTPDLLIRAGNRNLDQGVAIAKDASDNIYITGSFDGVVTFGSTTLTSAGSGDIFVAKYSASGSLLWALRAGGGEFDVGNGITVDNSGVYITGRFGGMANFNTPSDPSSNTLISDGDSDIFVAGFDVNTGQLLWAQRAGGSKFDEGKGITVYNGGIYVTGYFTGTANFNTPSSLTSHTLVSTAQDQGPIVYGDIFVAKYDAAGTVQWLRRAGGEYNNSNIGITADISGVYVTGSFSGTANFNTPSDPASNTLISAGPNTDIFVAKYNADGLVQWLRRAGGSGSDVGMSITVANSMIYVTGQIQGIANFNTPSNPASNTLISAGPNTDIFVAKYNADGLVQWLRRAGGSASDYGTGIAVDMSGVYVSGQFTNIADFNTPSNPASNTLVSSDLDTEIFVAKYDDAGMVQWLRRIGGVGLEFVNGIVVGNAGVFVTGSFSGTANFNTPSDPTRNTLVSAGSADIFLARFSNLSGLAITGFAATATTVCAGTTASFTATVSNVTGSYDYTLTNGSSPVSGTATGTAFSQTVTAAGSGVQTYTLTIGASGTTISASTTITVSASPVAAISLPAVLTVTCAVPVVSVTATGGVGYRWENGTISAIRSLSTGGTYSVTVTGSSGCTASASEMITITQNTQSPTGATLTASSGGTLTCGQSALTLSASATGSGLSYSFSGPGILSQTGSSATVIAAGTYSVVITGSNGCTVLATTTVVSQTAVPSVSINPASASISCASPLVSLSAIGAGTVRWSTGETSAVISVSVADTYSVTLTDGGGCTAVTSRVVSGSLLGAVTVTAGSPIGCGVTTTTVQIAAQGATSFTLLGPNGYSQTNNTGDFSVSTGGNYTGLAGQAGCVVLNTVAVIEGGVQPAISSAQATGVLGSSSCSVSVQAAGYGDRYVLTGPGGYVFSVVYRTAGEHNVSFPAVVRQGTYILTVYSGNCMVSRPVAVAGTACP